MAAVATNLYRADDKLIKAGYVFGAVALYASYAVVQSVASPGPLGFIIAPLLLAAPVAMLGAGYAIRNREKRIVQIWRLIEKHGEMPVNDLISMTGFKREQLRNAVDLLNRKSVAGLTWDEASDSIRDVGLDRSGVLTHSQQCPSCGASVNVEVTSRSGADALACPYCNGALDSKTINKLQTKLHARESYRKHKDPAPEPQWQPLAMRSQPRSKPFNVPLFIILILFFWPAALYYAVKWANSAEHLRDVIGRD